MVLRGFCSRVLIFMVGSRRGGNLWVGLGDLEIVAGLWVWVVMFLLRIKGVWVGFLEEVMLVSKCMESKM